MKKQNADLKMRRALDALHRLYSVRDAAEFPHVMMSVADEVVSSVNISFDTVDLTTGVATDVFNRPTPISHEEFLRRWQVFCHEHPGIQFLAGGGKASVFSVTDFMTQREFRKTAIYHEIFHACGGGYQIGVILPVPGYVVGMAINRDTDFTVGEREFIELLQPHFVQAFQNAQLFTSLRGREEVDFRPWRNRGFTRRECEVLQWLMEGKRNSEIGIILGAKTRTISKHVENILAKFHVESRTAAAAEARHLLANHFIPPRSGR